MYSALSLLLCLLFCLVQISISVVGELRDSRILNGVTNLTKQEERPTFSGWLGPTGSAIDTIRINRTCLSLVSSLLSLSCIPYSSKPCLAPSHFSTVDWYQTTCVCLFIPYFEVIADISSFPPPSSRLSPCESHRSHRPFPVKQFSITFS